MQKVAGTAYLRVGGEQYPLAGRIGIMPTRETREDVVGVDGSGGYKETVKFPHIEVELTTVPALSVGDLWALRDITVQAELANGNVWVLYEAVAIGEPNINPVDGTLTGVTFSGPRMEQSA